MVILRMRSNTDLDMPLDTSVPLVSIVVPTFNQVRYLPATIDHCLFQTYPNIEIVIVDGGSTDGTKEYLQKLENEIRHATVSPVSHMNDNGMVIRKKISVYPQNRMVKIITFDHDIGATKTYNEGFKKAS